MTFGRDPGDGGLGPSPDEVHTLLVLRPGGIAEMVKAVPALRHLNCVYSDSEITLAAPATSLELVRGCPYLTCRDIAEIDCEVAAEYDLVVSLAPPHEQPVDLRRLRDCATAAYRAEGTRSSLPVHPIWPRRACDSYRMLRLVWLLGGSQPDTAFAVWPELVDRNKAAQLTSTVERPLAIVHPGSGCSERRWPAASFARVIDSVNRLGLTAAVVGLVDDEPLVDEIADLCSTGFVDLVGRTSTGVLAALVERASLFVGTDSGPAAIACAMGVRSIVIGPASAVEQPAYQDCVTFVTADGLLADQDEVQCDLAPARDVPLEAVLSEVVLAAERGRSGWQSSQLP